MRTITNRILPKRRCFRGKRKSCSKEELKRTDKEDEQSAVEIISRIQTSIEERQRRVLRNLKSTRTIFETRIGEKLTQRVRDETENRVEQSAKSNRWFCVFFVESALRFLKLDERRRASPRDDADPPSEKFPADEQNCWFEFIVQVPKFATSVEFVVSDADEVSWDNNESNDYVVVEKRERSRRLVENANHARR